MLPVDRARLNQWRIDNKVNPTWLDVGAITKGFHCERHTVAGIAKQLAEKGLAVQANFGVGYWLVCPNAIAKHFAEGFRSDATYQFAFNWIKEHPTEAKYWPIEDILTAVQSIDPDTNLYCIRKALDVARIKRWSSQSTSFRIERREYVTGWLRSRVWIYLESHSWREGLAHYARYNDEHKPGCRAQDMPQLTFKYYWTLVKKEHIAVFSDETRRIEEREEEQP